MYVSARGNLKKTKVILHFLGECAHSKVARCDFFPTWFVAGEFRLVLGAKRLENMCNSFRFVGNAMFSVSFASVS